MWKLSSCTQVHFQNTLEDLEMMVKSLFVLKIPHPWSHFLAQFCTKKFKFQLSPYTLQEILPFWCPNPIWGWKTRLNQTTSPTSFYPLPQSEAATFTLFWSAMSLVLPSQSQDNICQLMSTSSGLLSTEIPSRFRFLHINWGCIPATLCETCSSTGLLNVTWSIRKGSSLTIINLRDSFLWDS